MATNTVFQDIDQVFQEVDSLESEPTGSFLDETHQLNEGLVRDELESLSNDKALTSLHASIGTCRNQLQQLCMTLGFITECLPKKGTKSPPAEREAACGKFHRTLVKNLPAVTSVTTSTQLSSFLAMRVFKRLFNPVPVAASTSAEAKVYTQDELDILTYIAGAVVASVRKAAKRKGQDEASYIEVLSHLVTDGECENGRLVACLDRGGLVKVKPQVSHMFIAMEDVFNASFQGTTFSVQQFVQACGENDDILCGFYETVYECSVKDSLKEDIIIRMINLFFTIRVHQKCRVFMDKVRLTSTHSKKEKALRKKLCS